MADKAPIKNIFQLIACMMLGIDYVPGKDQGVNRVNSLGPEQISTGPGKDKMTPVGFLRY